MSICTAPSYKMDALNNLFIEMTSKNCNHRCKSCFIDFPVSKPQKDFISVDTVKEALISADGNNLYCIYLSGAEPMLHPDFNTILRLCLKKYNVCICTNGSFLNEKKIRFLKKVEDEGNNQIFFKLTLTHYNELENDSARYRGNFRQTVFALKSLTSYNFNSVLNVQNYYNLDNDDILNNFKLLFETHNITNTDLKIIKSFPTNSEKFSQNAKPDCINSRVISQYGVYSCPFLANDYRGRCGINLKDYSKVTKAETDFCLTCASNINPIFSIG